MSDPLLDVLKLALLALLYLFFARVLWAVWSEVRPPRARAGGPSPAVGRVRADDATAATERPPTGRRSTKPHRGRRGRAARLVVLEPKEQRGTIYAISGELTIGRESACTVPMPGDTFVSGLHARVYEFEGQPMLEDLGSTNGTFHNGNRLHGSKLLHPGDRIQIGYTVLEAQ